MGQIFLSYAREDRRAAQTLARVVESAGHDVWWDCHIESGEEFADRIEAALNKAQVVLVAWSAESVKSRWVRDEAAAGGDTGRLVPVSIDGSLAPMGFRQFHTMDLKGWKGSRRDARTSELLQAIDRRIQGKASETPAASSRKPGASLDGINVRAIAAAILLVATIGAGLWFWGGRWTESGPPAKPTMALLPLTTASPDPQLRELASATRDSLSNKLSQSGIPVRLLASAPQDPRSAGDYIVSGDLSRDGGKVEVTLHLDEVTRGVTMSSYQFEAAGEDVRNLPERIGVQMAANLSWSAPLMILDKRHPADPALIAKLMQGSNYSTDFLEGYQSAKSVVARASDLRIAQTALAYYTSFVLDAFPVDQRAAAIADARHAYAKARSLDPHLGDVEGAWCSLHSDALFRECEDHLRAGIARSPDDNWLTEFLAGELEEVGRFDEAAQLQQLSYTHDPFAPVKIEHMLTILDFTGDTAAADELYQNGSRWWPDHNGSFLRHQLMGLIWRGDFPAIARLEKQARWPHYHSSAAIISALKSRSVPSLRAACADAFGDNADAFLPLRCFVAFNQLGDEDSVYTFADKMYPRRLGATPAQTEQIWLDAPDGGAPLELLSSAPAAPMRRDARFLAVAERTGLLAYWRSGRPPDFCRGHPEAICYPLLRGS